MLLPRELPAIELLGENIDQSVQKVNLSVFVLTDRLIPAGSHYAVQARMDAPNPVNRSGVTASNAVVTCLKNGAPLWATRIRPA
jgi:hypothetical protein